MDLVDLFEAVRKGEATYQPYDEEEDNDFTVLQVNQEPLFIEL